MKSKLLCTVFIIISDISITKVNFFSNMIVLLNKPKFNYHQFFLNIGQAKLISVWLTIMIVTHKKLK